MAGTTSEQATESQLQYIKELVYQGGRKYRALIQRGDQFGVPLTARQLERARVLAELWAQVRVRDAYSKQQASNWITVLKDPIRFGGNRPEEVWLDKPAIAEAFGLAEYVNEHRDAIEAALRRVGV